MNTGGGWAVIAPGCWTYAPRHQRRIKSYEPRRPLLAVRDNVVVGCLQGRQVLYRRQFTPQEVEKFDFRWITGWAAGALERDGKPAWRSYRIAEKAKWRVALFDPKSDEQVEALAMAAGRIYLVSSKGSLIMLNAASGERLAEAKVPAPLWDGLAVADGRLFLTTADGHVLCLGSIPPFRNR